jgi:hypothetical protein
METNCYILESFCLFVLFFSIFYIYVYLPNKTIDINNVYRKLYKHIENKKSITSLCAEMKHCLYRDEFCIVYDHFHKQKPSGKIHKEFYDNKYFIGGMFWWEYTAVNKKMNNEFTKQRKLFILKMIEITNKK